MWYSSSEFSSMRRSTTSDPTATFSTREPVVAASSIPTWTMISSSAPGTCTSVGAVGLAAAVEGPAAGGVVAPDELEVLEALAVGGAAVVPSAVAVVAVVARAVVAEPLEELSPPQAAVTPSATTGTTRRRHGVLMLGDAMAALR